MEMARRMQCRIPAFGEWNYDDDGTATAVEANWTWSVSRRFGAVIRGPVAANKPIKRATASAAATATMARSMRGGRRVPAFGQWNNLNGDGDGIWPAAMHQYWEFESKPVITHKSFDKVGGDGNVGVATGKHFRVKQGSRVADYGGAGAHAAAGKKHFSSTVAGAVDDDLYEVPHDMPCHKLPGKSRSRWLGARSLLMGCLCLGVSCIA